MHTNTDVVRHYTCNNLQEVWKLGPSGFLLRIRGQVSSGILTLFSMGAPFWWPEAWKIDSFKQVPLVYLVPILSLIFGGIFFLWIYKSKSNYKRALKIKGQLHNLVEFARDYNSAIHSGQMDVALKNYVKDLCNKSKDYFKELFIDGSIEVCVRLAENRGDGIYYRTFGRSSGLSDAREQNSQPIKIDSGVPRQLSLKECKGVLVYNDLAKAIDQGMFQGTKNENDYADEIASLLIAPLNITNVQTKQKEMIGILYVTCRNRFPFHPRHLDAVGFISDFLAMSINGYVELLRGK